MKPIYLDHNATTPIDPRVIEAMERCFRETTANAGSQHSAGRQAKRALEDAREEIISVLRGDPAHDRLILTSGGTEANNLAILGMGPESRRGRILVSAIEHPSTLAAADELERQGWQVDHIPASESGAIDLEELRTLLEQSPHPRLVSVMAANNETGVIQPLEEVVELSHAAGVPVHSDAVQVVGKMPFDFGHSGVDAISFAAHKFHGPAGIGGLLVREQTQVQPILFGGSQQLGKRPGTEPVALVVGMMTALNLWNEEADQRESGMRQSRDHLENLLLQDSTAVVNGQGERLPHTLNLSFLGLDRQAMLMALDMAGVACSTGSACASGSSEPSHVLQAMGLETGRIESSLRLSLGATSSLAEIDEAAKRILKTAKHLRQSETAPNSSSEPREKRPKSL